jgi:simple sugar transport system substrate-binding protein
MKQLLCFLILSFFIFSCANNKKDENMFSVGVFIPGVTEGSPMYESMASGALSISNENIKVKVIEAGYNQSAWKEKLMSFALQGNYDIILTTNPALSEICNEVSQSLNNQKFIITDSYYIDNTNIATYMFNQYEQSYVLGYMAGLISRSNLDNIVDSNKIGFIASQEFPLLNKHILPGFLDGAKKVDDNFELDFRVVGNWYDSSKALEITKSMIASGVNVIATITGGASVGVINGVKEEKKYMVYHDTDAYSKAEGVILLSGQIEQYQLTREVIINASKNKIEYGKNKVLGIKEGYISILNDSEYHINYVPLDIRDKISNLVNDIKDGKIIFEYESL